MKKILAFLFFTLSLTSEEAPINFEADEAAYNGSEMVLSGNVLLEHELGALSAGHALLTVNAEGKKLRISHLKLCDHVTFDLSEGGQLSCAEADLDSKTALGEFSGSPQQPFVVYMEQCRDASGSQERLPLILKSRVMTVEFKPGAETPKSHIHAVVAKENVTVDYNHDFIAAADRATFHREGDPVQKGLTGIICLHAEGADGHCHVTNRNGDLIHARQIFIDTMQRRLTFAHPKGALFTHHPGEAKKRLDFSADMMNWEEKQGALNLQGQVMIAEKGLGQLTTDDQVTLYHDRSDGRKQLQTIESIGHSVLKHLSPEPHTLQCWNKMVVDHAHLKVLMDSPESGTNQVFYEDSHGSLYADRIEAQYDWSEGAIKPTKIALVGEVKMISKPSGDKQRFALADRVDVFPETQEAHLFANSGRRVLIYDQTQDLKVSAEGITIKRDKITGKDAIQGVGDVRFTLLDPELEQLFKRFEQLQKYGKKHE